MIITAKLEPAKKCGLCLILDAEYVCIPSDKTEEKFRGISLLRCTNCANTNFYRNQYGKITDMIKIPESVMIAENDEKQEGATAKICLLYTSPSPRDRQKSRMPSSA